MPPTRVLFYAEADGSSPVARWLDELRRSDRQAFAKVAVRISRLAALGHELRRPEADLLRDGIHELRVGYRHVNYRVLYFFHGAGVTILTHALTKEAAVPQADIDRSLRRKAAFEHAPTKHTYAEAWP